MNPRSIKLVVRHYRSTDIPIRARLLRDAAFEANLNGWGSRSSADAIRAREEHTITDGQWTKRVYTVTKGDGVVVGFCWITSLDVVAAHCELSFAILPEYRGAYGLLVHTAASWYVWNELGMAAVTHQVLGHNSMFVRRSQLNRYATLVSRNDDNTAGQDRDAFYWTEDRKQFLDAFECAEQRWSQLKDRLRTKVEVAS
ncbi:GNAT family N-acetyltransferase [Flexivirga oryzae]|uniref:N-acetyltransferase domain-containing protein n=1 Tax=Flexivirga oryzae TaxID=1794944 RepID=A0A839NBI4_9MICO|nr:GNAT family N-acetyltransferase [Flexivirga oryzae]MBB2893334.1 hypothetical protein [Flexivirga oryzae]